LGLQPESHDFKSKAHPFLKNISCHQTFDLKIVIDLEMPITKGNINEF
jgi:hypothetical protein